jgi:hypothetical protein
MDPPEPPGRHELHSQLERLRLGSHIEAMSNMGIRNIESLLILNDEQDDDLHEMLQEEGVAKQIRRDFRRWLREKREGMSALRLARRLPISMACRAA